MQLTVYVRGDPMKEWQASTTHLHPPACLSGTGAIPKGHDHFSGTATHSAKTLLSTKPERFCGSEMRKGITRRNEKGYGEDVNACNSKS
eukprot:3572512-Amphidinium_carterae.1